MHEDNEEAQRYESAWAGHVKQAINTQQFEWLPPR